MSVGAHARRSLEQLGRWVAGWSPRTILVVGWLLFMLYAYPGYLSFDSVYQLLEARSGEFGDAHPPMMGALWQLVDMVIAGPFGMLVIQTTTFLAGAYLLLGRFMAARTAAVCASVLLLLPPVAAVMAVIWKDSQMTGFLLLGTALLLSPRRWVKLVGLALMVMATAMRHNAFSLTFTLIGLLFTWSPTWRWYKRYPVAVAAWLAVTISAQLLTGALSQVNKRSYLWHDALALLDIVGTLQFADPISDDQLHEMFKDTPLIPQHDIQEAAKRLYRPEDIVEKARRAFGTGNFITPLWTTTYHFFDVPKTMPERYAIERAWKQLIPSHPGAYLAYRWHVLLDRVQLHDDPIPSAAYVWFTDVLDPATSATKIGHSAAPARIQDALRDDMRWFGSTWLFRPYVYLLVTLVLLPLYLRDRTLLALGSSGIAGEAALFVVAPTIDYRYSFWLVVTTIMLVMMLVAKRVKKY